MNESQRSTEYIFQGTMYFFRREKILCRYQFALQDAVEPALLQRALEAALSAAPYYRVQLVQEKRSFFLEPNPNPCLVYQGSAQRDIPEETNGYLFSVSCEGDTVYFDWYHFLMDGHGVSPFLTRILEQYCNLRYGTAFANTPIVCSPAYDIEAMMEKYPPLTATESTMQRDVVQTWEGRMRRTRVRLTKQSLVDRAVENGVKPFTALAGLLSLALRSYLGKDEIQYSYSADTRREAGVPDALYNCVCSFQDNITLTGNTRLADIVPGMDAFVRRSLQPEAKLQRMAEQMGVQGGPAESAPAHQAAGVPDGRVHQRCPGGFLAQLSGKSAAAGHAGASEVHQRLQRLGPAGWRLHGRGSLQPERHYHPVHREQGRNARPCRDDPHRL